MLNISRRKLLAGIAPAGLLAVAGCATTTTNGVTTVTLDPKVIGFVQTAVADAAKYIPAVESIVATAASLFGPQYAAIVTFGSNAINTLIAALESAVSSLTPPAAARLGARLRASSPTSPVLIGRTSTGVTVYGYRV